MKLEKYKQRDPKKTGIILFTVVCVLLIAGVFFYTSFASFETHDEFNIIKGTVESNGDVYFAYYVDDELTYTMPLQNSGYIFDEEKSSCTNEAKVTWNYEEWAPLVNNLTETRTKCTLHFKKTKTVDTVLGKLEVYEYTPDFSKSACDDETCESHEKGIFETTDKDGTTYYYRGSVENNYVYFANRYWRIIRINGDGTIRIVYDGTTAHENGEVSEDRYYQISAFNQKNDDNMYIGYMYTENEINGISNSSNAKEINDMFYEEVLFAFSSYIDINAGFCGDRSAINLQEGFGVGKVTTYNKCYLKVVESTPDLACENEQDLYTVLSSNQGNKALSYPIGLITVDEVMLAGFGGGVFDGNYNHQKSSKDNFLAIGKNYWTISPAGTYNPFGSNAWRATMFFVSDDNLVDDYGVNSAIGIRPVINIRKNVTITGEGTKEILIKFLEIKERREFNETRKI